jgi:hypothetical protein
MKEDNDPAYPTLGFLGLRIRDYFAGQALVGLLASDAGAGLPPRSVAQDAYLLADAMLAAREAR